MNPFDLNRTFTTQYAFTTRSAFTAGGANTRITLADLARTAEAIRVNIPPKRYLVFHPDAWAIFVAQVIKSGVVKSEQEILDAFAGANYDLKPNEMLPVRNPDGELAIYVIDPVAISESLLKFPSGFFHD